VRRWWRGSTSWSHGPRGVPVDELMALVRACVRVRAVCVLGSRIACAALVAWKYLMVLWSTRGVCVLGSVSVGLSVKKFVACAPPCGLT
jgi:hypothetical protein